MGKRIIQQRRGKGSATHRVSEKAYAMNLRYPHQEGEAEIIRLENERGYTYPIAKLKLGNEIFFNIAVEGIKIGDKIMVGKNVPMEKGNITSLENIPIGTFICNVEIRPYSRGQLVKSAGTSAQVAKKTPQGTIIILPSKKEKLIDNRARATIGIVSGAGRPEKPFIKAGNRWHVMKSKNKLYPRTSPVKMNAVNHPFGGGRGKNIGKTSIAPRNAPPGRKVGLLRPRKTGRGK